MSLFVAAIVNHFVASIFIVISIYGNIKLWRRRHEMFVKKRSLSIVFGLNISFILIIISLELTVIMCTHYLIISSPLILIPIFFMFFAIWLLLCMLITKTWMLYYKTKWTYYALEYKWQQLINPNILSLKGSCNKKRHWFIVNNIKYGNLLFMYKPVASLCVIGFLLCFIPSIFNVTLGYPVWITLITAICVILSWIPAVIIYTLIIKKTPSFDDVFYIHWESKMHSKILIFLVFAVNVPCSILSVLISYHVWLYAAPIFSTVWFAMNFVSTFVICNKQQLTKSNANKLNVANINFITLDMILSNTAAFHLFMQHLSSEYSMECLLSYIEFMQFQNYLSDSMNVATLNQIKHTEFPSNIPISTIIEQEDDFPDNYTGDKLLAFAKIKARNIFIKYIRPGSEFEINISFAERERISNVLGDPDLQTLFASETNKKDLFLLFESCKEDMLLFLNFSLARFRQKEAWTLEMLPIFVNEFENKDGRK